MTHIVSGSGPVNARVKDKHLPANGITFREEKVVYFNEGGARNEGGSKI
jgi:hypothetical protein